MMLTTIKVVIWALIIYTVFEFIRAHNPHRDDK